MTTPMGCDSPDPTEAAVRAIVDRAPPLSDEQADRLSQLLTPPVKSRGAA